MLSALGRISRARVGLKVCNYCVVIKRLSANMCESILSQYEEAVYALNGLQSNAVTLQKSYAEKDAHAYKKLTDTVDHLKTLGIQVLDLNSLNIIHVAGTKGKGSTCAFVESIVRRHGYKTGFYSSPHLVSVNERIRINGVPIDKSLFVKYFWEVYNPLQQNLKNGETMPPYFMFLTIMAFYVFIKEQVEAAVMEVGIGGLYDCTNIVKKPVVVGVTSLGIDHVNLLGNTLPLIAQQKAGIFKSGVPAFTVPQQDSAMKVLHEKAKEVNCPLKVVPPLEIYEEHLNLGVPGDVQTINASLAIQLASVWLKRHNNKELIDTTSNENNHLNEAMFIPMAVPLSLDTKFKEGLESCIWPGRCQTIKKHGVTLYLDGAHTNQSLKYCAKWFQEASEKEKMTLQSPVLRVLLFNCTGQRNAESLLDPLLDMAFDLAIFTPNRKTIMKDSSSDQSNFTIEPLKEMRQCALNKEAWGHLIRSINEDALSILSQSSSNGIQHDVSPPLLKEENSIMFCCLSQSVNWLIHKKHINHCLYCDNSKTFSHLLKGTHHIQVLVTGSLHLVGGVMALIDS